jgi:hypothetical protein
LLAVGLVEALLLQITDVVVVVAVGPVYYMFLLPQ